MRQPSWAQTTTTTKEAGKTEVTTEQITGEVVLVDNNILLARMQPSGQYRMNETSTECVEHVTAERLVKLPKIPQLDLPPLLTRDRLNCSMAGPG